MSEADAGARSPTLRLATRGSLFDCQAALESRLEVGFPSKQFTRAYLPAKPSPATWKRVLVRPPMVGICWLGLAPDEKSGRIMRGTSDYLLYFACRNPKPEQLLLGDSYGVGMLGLAGLATALLHEWTVPDLGTWSVRSIDNAALQDFIDEEIGVVAIQASCTLSVVDPDAAAALPEFLRLGADWTLPALDNTTLDVRQAA